MTNVPSRLLFVDDDAATRKAMGLGLKQDGFEVVLAASAEEALPIILSRPLDALITDVVMGGMSGLALLRKVRSLKPGLPVIVITGYGSVEAAVEAMREGARDYLAKPIQFDHLARVLQRVLHRGDDDATATTGAATVILGTSKPMRRVLQRLATVAPTDATVLVRGESGTGKELIVRALHAASPRARRPLVVMNCAAISESLAESELFGHEKGAFTGAAAQRKGKVEQADGGTLFLDEVGDLSPALQTKLLRVLQDRVVERLGGSQSVRVDVRLVAATNRDLEQLIADGRFREDLYYRLKVVTIDAPPLRERLDDLPLLVHAFLEELCRRHGRTPVPALGRGVLDALRAHPWPGNVRELRNLVEELVILTGGDRLHLADLPAHLRLRRDAPTPDAPPLDGLRSLDDIEREAIRRTLERTGGNKTEAARILGIGLKTLYRKLGGE